jgi:hypothetical protein
MSSSQPASPTSVQLITATIAEIRKLEKEAVANVTEWLRMVPPTPIERAIAAAAVPHQPSAADSDRVASQQRSVASTALSVDDLIVAEGHLNRVLRLLLSSPPYANVAAETPSPAADAAVALGALMLSDGPRGAKKPSAGGGPAVHEYSQTENSAVMAAQLVKQQQHADSQASKIKARDGRWDCIDLKSRTAIDATFGPVGIVSLNGVNVATLRLSTSGKLIFGSSGGGGAIGSASSSGQPSIAFADWVCIEAGQSSAGFRSIAAALVARAQSGAAALAAFNKSSQGFFDLSTPEAILQKFYTSLTIAHAVGATHRGFPGSDRTMSDSAASSTRRVEEMHLIFPDVPEYNRFVAFVRWRLPALQFYYVASAQLPATGSHTKILSAAEITLCESWHVPPASYISIKKRLLSSTSPPIQCVTDVMDAVQPPLDCYRFEAIVAFMHRSGWIMPHTIYRRRFTA